jgi:hypothetical protein
MSDYGMKYEPILDEELINQAKGGGLMFQDRYIASIKYMCNNGDCEEGEFNSMMNLDPNICYNEVKTFIEHNKAFIHPPENNEYIITLYKVSYNIFEEIRIENER